MGWEEDEVVAVAAAAAAEEAGGVVLVGFELRDSRNWSLSNCWRRYSLVFSGIMLVMSANFGVAAAAAEAEDELCRG